MFALEFTPAVWQRWCLVALAIVLVVAVDSDVRERRVPNLLVLLALCAGFALNITGPAGSGAGMFSNTPGALGAAGAALGAITGLAVFLPLYAFRAMGAGDVKLMAALGSFTGPAEAVSLALCILIAGGALAVVRMLQFHNGAAVASNLRTLLHSGHRGTLGSNPGKAFPLARTADGMPFTLAFAAGCAVYATWRLAGGAPLMSN